ncbi:MAG: RDD family protein [Pirellulales bacterium]|nr:RDD family protein [Pirellulales bacterium]
MHENENPYAAPQILQTASAGYIQGEELHEIVPAGQWPRLMNFIIDQFAILGLNFIVALLILFVGGEESLDKTPDALVGLPSFLSYYILMEATTQRTIGKFLTGTIVVNEQGGKPSLGQILGRSFARLIPFEAFSFLGTPTRGWHDKLPKTYVIKVR